MEQAANGSEGQVINPVGWTSGALTANKAHLRDGMTIPYRMEITDLSPSKTYCVTIAWSTRSKGRAAIDFITSYNRSEFHNTFAHNPELIDPLEGTVLEGLTAAPHRFPIPAPGSTGSSQPGQPTTRFNQLATADRQLALFNGLILSANYVVQQSLAGANTQTQLQICFRPNSGQNAVVLAWGGHIAEQGVWGVGQVAVYTEGTPYQTSVAGCSGLIGCGNRNLVVNATAVKPSTDCIIKGPAAICEGQRVVYEAEGVSDANRFRWSIINSETGAVMEGGTTNIRRVILLAGTGTGYFDLRVEVNGVLICSRTIFVFNPGAGRLSPARQVLCTPGQVPVLQWEGLPDDDRLLRVFNLRDASGRLIGTAPDEEGIAALLPGRPGTYYVTGKVSANGNDGCSAETPRVAVVAGSTPQVDFQVDASCLGSPTAFADRTVTAGRIRSWEWTFGDGRRSTQQNPVNRYAQPGTYTVRLAVTDTSGCGSFAEKQIVIESPPVVMAGNDTVICQGGGPVILRGRIQPADLAGQWSDGGINGSFSLDPGLLTGSYTPPANFSGTIRLILKSADPPGACGPVSDTLRLLVQPLPVPSFQTGPACDGSPVVFTSTTVAGTGSITDFQWQFGDGTESNDAQPSHLYAGPGTYQLNLTVTNSAGCSQSITRPVVVNPIPVVDFTVQGECPEQATVFSSQVQVPAGGDVAYRWTFGDGSISEEESPEHTFATGGNYTIRLVVTDKNGCSAETIKQINIRAKPQVGFTVQSVCFDQPVVFVNTSSAGAMSWSFGDGSSSDELSPTHSYAAPGTYQATLTVTDGDGCTASVSRQVTVNRPPAAAFSVADGCQGLALSLQQGSSAGTGAINSYQWDLGDGRQVTGALPSIVYTKAGDYTIRLTASDANGCRDTVEAVVKIWPSVAVEAGPEQKICSGLSVQLGGSVSGGASKGKWSDGGLGGVFSPSADALDGTYTPPAGYAGPVVLTLTSENPEGPCAAVSDQFVLTVQGLPVVSFQADPVCSGRPTQFVNTSTGGSGAITSVHWDFGDGEESTVSQPSHTYAGPGVYDVTLTITNAAGCEQKASKQARVNERPTAVFTVSGGNCQGQSLVFDNQSEGGAQYLWNFGDGATTTQRNTTHTYNSAGSFTVRLQVTGANGCSTTMTRELTVRALPKAAFTAEAVCHGGVVNFVNTSQGGGASPVYQWDFGDGNGSSEVNPDYTYKNPGAYQVTLTVTDPFGCSATASRQVTVHRPPSAAFTVADGCQGVALSLQQRSGAGSGAINSYQWDLGDGRQLTGATPSIIYSKAGDYNIRLTVTDINGCRDTVETTVKIWPSVAVEAGPDRKICTGLSVQLGGSVSGGASKGKWSDGGRGGMFSPSADALDAAYTPPVGYAGPVVLTLTSENPEGPCAAVSDQFVLTVQALPVVSFQADPVCSGRPTQFVNTSTGGSGAISSVRWDFGDGSESTVSQPAHTYAGPGVYNVTLTITNAAGCEQKASKQITVNARPTAVFTVSGSNCQGQSLVFDNQSQGGAQYLWNFGDGVTSTLRNTTHTFNSAGSFTVRLQVTGENGCSTTMSREVTVRALPNPAFTADPVCEGGVINFVNTTQGAGPSPVYDWNFGDGNSSSETNPRYSYKNPGVYQVTLTVTGTFGCRATATRQVQVFRTPAAAFAASGACAGSAVVFTNQSVAGSSATLTYDWDFGDGGKSSQRTPEHTFKTTGAYTVRLTVTDANGCSDSHEAVVNVFPSITVGAGRDTAICAGNSIQLKGSINGGTAKGNWSDGGRGGLFVPGADVVNATYTPPAGFAGPLTLTLTSEDPDGPCGAKSDDLALMVWALPAVSFKADPVCEGRPVQFVNTSSGGSGAVTGVKWTFGDGKESTESQPVHQYASPGTYKVTLTVTNSSGCVHSASQNVVIYPRPIASFSVTSNCPGQPLAFNNESQVPAGQTGQYLWEFGDGATSSERNPSHTYAAGGSYTVRLRVTGENSCSTTMSKEVTVLAGPKGEFAAQIDCNTRTAVFSTRFETLGGTITSYNWAFGDGATSADAAPRHVYSQPGTYTVALEVSNNLGCRQRIEGQVIIPAAPEAAFDLSDGCEAEGVDLQVVNRSKPASGSAGTMTYRWLVLDSRGREMARSQEANPGFNLAPGTYTVELSVSDGLNCSSSASRQATVSSDPKVSITAGVGIVCKGEQSTLPAIPSGGMDCGSIQWQFARAAAGPWNIIAGASSPTYKTRADLASGLYYFRVLYSCGGANCSTATSNIVTLEVGLAQPNLGCNARINLPLGADCRATVTPEMVAAGSFGHCFPYRSEDFEVIVYDGQYSGGDPNNIVDAAGTFTYTLQLTEAARLGGGVFTPCWGEVFVTDQTPPVVTCPADVTGLLKAGVQFRPAFANATVGAPSIPAATPGEVFYPLICSDVNRILNDERSWTDENYPYFTGLPKTTDCGKTTLLSVEDQLVQPGCTEGSLIFGGQVSARIVRTFTYADESGNQSKCDQNIYFFRPRIQLPDCKEDVDLCAYTGEAQLLPAALRSAPYYFTGTGDTLLLTDYLCSFSVVYQDQRFPGPTGCGFKVIRTWTLLDECRNTGLNIDLVDLPAGATGCLSKPVWSGGRMTFEQTITVGDSRLPVVQCPAPEAGAAEQVFSTGPFNCTGVVNPPAPIVSGECQTWTWTFELHGNVVNPLTGIAEYKLIGRAQNQILAGVAPGKYDLIYQVTDACGNSAKSGKCAVRVTDLIDPVAICNNEVTVSLGNGSTNNANGIARLLAEDIDEGSSDNCGTVALHIRRVIAADCLDNYVMTVIDPARRFADLRRQPNTAANRVEYYNGNKLVITLEGGVYWSNWDAAAFFTCCEAGGAAVAVELRVTDGSGNINICTSKARVEDKLPPRCSVSDVVIRCTELDFDPRDLAQVAARFGAAKDILTITDNCSTTISERLIWTPGTCGRGTLERIFTVTDKGGLSSSCTQTIRVETVTNYEVRLPADAENLSCGQAGTFDIQHRTLGCDVLAINRDTARFDPTGGACHRLMVTYEVINWCEYTGTANTTPTRIARDIDGDNVLAEPTWLIVAFDSTLKAVVAKIYGADAGGNRLSQPSKVFKPGDAGYNPGYYRYTQFINVFDNTAPVVTVETSNLDFCSNGSPETGCKASYTSRLRATDECYLNTPELSEIRLLAGGVELPATDGAYTVSRSGTLVTVSGSLAIGSYQLALRFTDGCGNLAGKTVDFRILDCKAPAPICKEILNADLLPVDSDGNGRIDGGSVTVPATAFVASEIQDCSPFADEPVHRVKYYLSRQRPQSRADLRDQSLTFTCDNQGLNEVYVIALDAAGNFDFCQTHVFIQAGISPDPCNIVIGEGVIGGMISTEDRDPVEDVMVRLSGQTSAFVMTDASGMYSFETLEEGYDYTVAPLLNTDFVNGVTTFDLLQISKHILATDTLDSPYKMIAADANSDKKITSFDLIQFRKLILTLSTELAGNTSWRFVEGRYRFPDPLNPWSRSFPEIININDLFRLEEDGDFVAVKIGDINGNARTTRLATPEIRSGAGSFELETNEVELRAGETYRINIRAGALDQVEGFQFTMGWDSRSVSFADLEEGQMTTGQFGLFPEEGLLTASWIRPLPGVTGGTSDDRLFTLVFRALRSARLSEVLSVHSGRTPAEAYDNNGQLLEMGLAFGGLPFAGTGFRLYTPRPNPWRDRTILSFELPSGGEATLKIMDAQGRLLRIIRGRFEKGYNEVRLERAGLPGGVLFVVLETEGGTAVERMVLLAR